MKKSKIYAAFGIVMCVARQLTKYINIIYGKMRVKEKSLQQFNLD